MVEVKENVSLKPYHTFGLEVTARYFAAFQNEEELDKLLSRFPKKELPRLILGGGSNLLFKGNYKGVVLLNQIHGIALIHEDQDQVLIKVGAGENWHNFVMYCLEKGWYGIENLSLIPGTVGAAPIQNIGAYGVELKTVFTKLEAYEIANGQTREFDKAACQFGYRDSFFKQEGKNRYIITQVYFALSKKPRLHLTYGAIQSVLADWGIRDPMPADVSKAVIEIRRSKLPDPSEIGNSGSFFKNPEVSKSLVENLKKSHPDLPSYPQESGQVKLAAGWLIEQAGWKGYREGDAGVHKRQALVLVNYGNATGEEIYELAQKIQKDVLLKFGVPLEMEVNIIA